MKSRERKIIQADAGDLADAAVKGKGDAEKSKGKGDAEKPKAKAQQAKEGAEESGKQ